MSPRVRRLALIGAVMAVVLVSCLLILLGQGGGEACDDTESVEDVLELFDEHGELECGDLYAGGEPGGSELRLDFGSGEGERARDVCQGALERATDHCKGIVGAASPEGSTGQNLIDRAVECLKHAPPMLAAEVKRRPKTVAAVMIGLLIWGCGIGTEQDKVIEEEVPTVQPTVLPVDTARKRPRFTLRRIGLEAEVLEAKVRGKRNSTRSGNWHNLAAAFPKAQADGAIFGLSILGLTAAFAAISAAARSVGSDRRRAREACLELAAATATA